MNRQTVLAIGLTVVLALTAFGGTASGAVVATGNSASADLDSEVADVQQDGEENETTADGEATGTTDGQQNETVSIIAAMEAAQNETNGTAVGAELGGQDGGILGGDGNNQSYTVDALLDNGTHLQVDVNATNGSVVQVQQADDGFLKGIFGEDDVPDQPLNLSAMHTAIDAVELAQNETGDNGTVMKVNLATEGENDDLVYEVLFDRGEGNQVTVVVDAMKDGEGVMRTENGGGETTTAGGETTTEGGEGGG